MAGLWEEYSKTITLTTVGSRDSQEVFHNEVDDHIFASAPITIVDGIVTIMSDLGTDMSNIKLGIFPELYTSTDVEGVAAHDSQWWYKWYVQGGPLVFRLRSKRTIRPEHKLWISGTKSLATNTTTVNCGMEFFMVRHQ